MWIKIYEIPSKKSYDNEGDDSCHHCLCRRYQPADHLDNDNAGKIKELIKTIRSCLSHVQMIILSGAVLTILCIGEKNFFSAQVRYQTEPMASIGK